MATTHITHLWAHNESPTKTKRVGNMSFDGMSFYSYSTIIAVKYPEQKTCVVAGTGIYNSSTTNTHKSQATRALPSDWSIVTVDIPAAAGYYPSHGHALEHIKDLRKCHDYMVKNLRPLVKKAIASRKGISQIKRMDDFENALSNVNGLGLFLKRKAVTPERVGLSPEFQAEAYTAEIAWQQQENEKRERRQAAQLLAEQEAVELWKKHELPGGYYHSWAGTYLRLTKKGCSVQTSRGVTLPITEALKAYRLCKLAKDHPEVSPEFAHNVDINGYELREVNVYGDCVIGCHHLKFEEMERVYNEAVARNLINPKETNG